MLPSSFDAIEESALREKVHMADTTRSDEPETGEKIVEVFHSFRDQIYRHPEGGKGLVNVYDRWVDNYDMHVETVGYVGPVNLASLASEFISNKSAKILDVASGTGLLGKALKKLGFTCIDALDPSTGSLAYSKKLNVYTNYICDTLDEHQSHIADDCYDAVLMCGAFGIPGHVSDTCFPELIRITKPGGYIMFTVSTKVLEQCQDKMQESIESWSRQGVWEVVEIRWILYHVHETISEKAKVTILRLKN